MNKFSRRDILFTDRQVNNIKVSTQPDNIIIFQNTRCVQFLRNFARDAFQHTQQGGIDLFQTGTMVMIINEYEHADELLCFNELRFSLHSPPKLQENLVVHIQKLMTINCYLVPRFNQRSMIRIDKLKRSSEVKNSLHNLKFINISLQNIRLK